jgi:hypothetical protein
MYQTAKAPDTSLPYSFLNDLSTSTVHNNGKIYVYVLNPLSVPSSEPPNVDVAVFTSMCDDLDFAVPNANKLNSFSVFQNQGGFDTFNNFKLHGANDDPLLTNEMVQTPYDPGELV